VVRKLIILLMLIPALTQASDSLRTVSEFGRKIFHNMNMSDTLNGSDRFDSTDAQRCVRDAANEVGNLVGTEKAKRIVTSAGTWGYEVEKDLNSILAVTIKRTKFSKPVIVYPFEKLLEAYSQQSSTYDTVAYFGCGISGDSIYPYPIPNRVDTLYLIYRGSGTKVSTYSDTVNLSIKYYPAVEYLATAKAAAIMSRDATYWQAYFDKIVGGLK